MTELLGDISGAFGWIAELADAANWFTILTCLIAFWSLIVAKKAYKLAESTEKKSDPKIEIYLADSVLDSSNQDDLLFSFLLTINNLSNNANSVSRAELTISYIRQNSQSFALKVENKNKKYLKNKANENNYIQTPCIVGSHSSIKGWLLFSLPKKAVENSTIDSYLLTLTDTHGIRIEVIPQIVRSDSNGFLGKK